MATLKEFEEALREHGMNMALALLERLRERDRATRSVKPARRLTGQKMTPELARAILDRYASLSSPERHEFLRAVALDFGADHRAEIGRASCRERV